MRLFLAINLSRPMKDALVAAQNTMYDHGVRGNYTPEENLHLTLAFVGDYPEPKTVMDALSSVSFFPIQITLDGIGAFGDLWWAGLREAPALTAVVRRVRRALADSDIPFDRKRFSPHITLLRRARGEMPGITIEPCSMEADTISLMRSERGKNGMIYTELGAITAHERESP